MDDALKSLMKELEAPFSNVYQRQGRAGQVWDYLANADVVNRLNKVFGVGWSVIERHSEVVEGGRQGTHYVIKRVQLEVEDPVTGKHWVKEAWGSHPFMTDDPADAHKSAFSKAITKAASLLGIGLYLYGIEDEEPEVATAIMNGQGQSSAVPTNAAQEQFIEQEEETQYEPPAEQIVTPPAPLPKLKNPNLVAPQQTSRPAAAPKGSGFPANVPLIHPVGPVSGRAVGHAPQPGKPATARAVIQQVEVPQEPATDDSPTVYQLSTIRAVASMQHQDPMTLVYEVLGQEATDIRSLEELTSTQASRILAEKRKIQVEGKYK